MNSIISKFIYSFLLALIGIIYFYILVLILMSLFGLNGAEFFDHFISLAILLLPAMVANGIPVVLRHIPFFKKSIHVKWFGKNKTWRGFIGAIIAASIAFSLLVYLKILSLGVFGLVDSFENGGLMFVLFMGGAIGFGAIVGDLVFSFIKRRLNISSGKPFVPWDQIDYILGTLVVLSYFIDFHISYILFYLLFGGGVSFIAHHLAYRFSFIDTKC